MRVNNKFMFLFIPRRIQAALVLFGAVLLATTAWPAERQGLKGCVPEAVARGLAPAGRLPASQQLRLALGLPLRNQPALSNLLLQLYDPASPLFHQYLAPEQFTARFGPEEKDYQALLHFAQSHGLAVAGTHPNRMLLDVTGTVADVEKALHVQMGIYPHPTEPRTFYAPDVEPALDLDAPVLSIAGLSDFARPHPASLHARPAVEHPNAGSQSGYYVGLDFRAAYAPGVTLNGAGQSVGLVEFDTYYASDISKYLALPSSGLAGASVTLTNVVIDGPLGSPGDGNTEVALDIDMAISMAPGLSSVIVYEAPNNNSTAPADDVLNRMATDNLACQLSCSWTGFTDATIQQIFQEFAAQGQSFFIASGDDGAYVNPQNPVSPPSDDSYVTSVGGTTLSTAGPNGAWTNETTWNWFNTSSATNGSGGGISPTFAIPSWQQGVSMAANSGSATYRNIPDVALTADQLYVISDDGSGSEVGGTSAAAPLWAGFMALVNQQNAAVGNPPTGFFNPALYALCEGTNYAACFHDITTGNNTNHYSPNLFFAVPGYDLCTGWGTPAGSNLINALAAPADVLQITPLAGFSASATAGGPVKQASQSFLLTNTGTAAVSWTLSSPAAWLNNSASAGTLPAGGFASVTVSLDSAVAATLPAGVYTTNVSFQNTSDGVAQSRQFNLTLVGPQLVQNGGFETGDFTSWTLAGSSGSQANFVGSAASLPVTTGSGRHRTTTYDGSYYIHSGSYAAFLGQSGNLAYLSQTLTTVPGQAYWLSFWLVNPGIFANPPTPNEFTVAWNGNTLFNQANIGVFAYTNMQYVVFTTNTSTTLEFGAQNNPDYFGLDDVSVTPIPAPAFQSAVSINGSITLTWSAVTGVTYQLQYATTLGPPNWSNLGSPVAANSSAIATSDIQPADPQRFYRVVLAP
jgi:hypothetical protein